MAGIVQWQDIGLWSQEPGFDSQYSPPCRFQERTSEAPRWGVFDI